MNVEPGKPFPIGATYYKDGVNFCLYSDNATGVELCLFSSVNDKHETHRIKMKKRTHCVWHSFIPGLKAGQLYAYRVYGPYEPHNGHRFNPNKLLLDPYAKAITAFTEWRDDIFGYNINDAQNGNSFSDTDSAPFMPKCVVVDDAFNWEDDAAPKTKYHNSIIYELHVKGFTHLHPSIPKEIKGTYSALAHPETINYFKNLGITALELMPVQYFLPEGSLLDKGLRNYWGYNTVGYFAPDIRYASKGTTGEQVIEFKEMVKALHKAGIEVLMDVVYNHTGEGNHLGPTICFKGIDNAAYYRLKKNKVLYEDFTGTGNTLNSSLFGVLRMIMDSLRYWVEEMHVDGFRFDLAATLARSEHDINMLNAFFHIIYQDPVLSRVKLIAEPWDVGDNGYQIGEFPQYWVEWNGKFRDDVRSFWNEEKCKKGMSFISRFSGSPDLYKQRNRYPTASVNFVTAHDGFTLHDLVSYNQKHNELNRHDNTDGSDENYSFNFGFEGPTTNISINEIRKRQKRNFLTTLFLSQGTPMLLAGDESGRTQQGNNNAYCQDNELSWVNWDDVDEELQSFCKALIKFRKNHPVFARHCWFSDKTDQLPDVEWFFRDGTIIQKDDWHRCLSKCIGTFLKGDAVDDCSYNIDKLNDENFFVVFNALKEDITFKLPQEKYAKQWKKILNTCNENFKEEEIYQHDESLHIAGLSIVIMQACKNFQV
ncbi:MAG: glycogen debranching protein GlgX [Parafilimonas sp.]|nr:glycogen debranching protein GlgX [Parafilimonas sp.]